jgi:hypothetical protein
MSFSSAARSAALCLGVLVNMEQEALGIHNYVHGNPLGRSIPSQDKQEGAMTKGSNGAVLGSTILSGALTSRRTMHAADALQQHITISLGIFGGTRGVESFIFIEPACKKETREAVIDSSEDM